MPLNIPEILMCFSKTNYGRVSFEYAWICLKYNVKDNTYIRKALSALHQTSKIVLFEYV